MHDQIAFPFTRQELIHTQVSWGTQLNSRQPERKQDDESIFENAWARSYTRGPWRVGRRGTIYKRIGIDRRAVGRQS